MATATKSKKIKAKAKAKAGKPVKSPAKAERKPEAAPKAPRGDGWDWEELLAEAGALRDEGLTQAAIAEKLGTSVNKLTMVFKTLDLKPKDRIKGTDEEIADAIVQARDEDLQSWPTICVRTGFSQAKVKAIYEDTTGRTASQGYAVVQKRSAERAAVDGEAKAAKKAAKVSKGKRPSS